MAPAVMAWSSKGHRLITGAAVDSLDAAEQPWSRAARAAIVGASVQPDLMRSRELPQLRAVEAPQHYIDLELLQGNAVPEERWEYLRLLTRIAENGRRSKLLDGDVAQAGTLPYAIVEGTQRLAAIFAQLRVHADDPDLQSMAAYQAGLVAHFAQDLCQPLHTTVHHDGRARNDGSSPYTGIHQQVDALVQSVSLKGKEAADRPAQVLDPLFPAVLAALQESHSQVDRVYELARGLVDLQSNGKADPGLIEFARQRFERAVGLSADLIRTAWHLSASIDLPSWASDSEDY